MKINLIFITCIQISLLYGQVSYSTLDFNETSALLSDGGMLLHDPTSTGIGYEVPKGSGIEAIFASAFWFAGTDSSGSLATSCGTFGVGQDLFPGPYSSMNMYSDPSYLTEYSPSIWTVTKNDIENHILNYNQVGYTIPASIFSWPGNGYVALGTAQNLAPFIDVNNDNIYSPQDGDYPDIRGDMASYIIMNDMKGLHTNSNGLQLGIEVHVMAYQYVANSFIDSTTFLNVRVFNRGTTNFQNFRFAYYLDADIGHSSDDYTGCDSSKNLIYTYNSDNFDDTNYNGYGNNPPCIGVVSLTNPMVYSGYYSNATNYPHNDPGYADEFWNFMNGSWANGSAWYYGGMGYSGSTGVTSIPANYLFSGNPYTGIGWSELSNANQPGDRRMFMVLDSVNLNQNQETCMDLAIIYSRQGNHLENVQGVIDLADSVKQFFDSHIEFNCQQVTVGIEKSSIESFSIYPNPSNGQFTLVPDTKWSEFELKISDVTGKVIFKNEFNSNEPIPLMVHTSAGIYLMTIQTGDQVFTRNVVIE